ncbi:hypothetical protein [Streptomyces atratus]|uniref:hypothetical protein n=1 Tax=Streptomyces atratus TaxID=1893 RepID=UPI00365F239E
MVSAAEVSHGTSMSAGPQRVGIPLLDAVPEVRTGRHAVHTAMIGAIDLHIVAVQHTAERDGTAEQYEEARGRFTLPVNHASGRPLLSAAALRRPIELFVAEFLEQEQRPRLLR